MSDEDTYQESNGWRRSSQATGCCGGDRYIAKTSVPGLAKEGQPLAIGEKIEAQRKMA